MLFFLVLFRFHQHYEGGQGAFSRHRDRPLATICFLPRSLFYLATSLSWQSLVKLHQFLLSKLKESFMPWPQWPCMLRISPSPSGPHYCCGVSTCDTDVWRAVTENGRAMSEIGVSDDLMAMACLVPGDISMQRCRMPSCCGNAQHEETLC